MAVRCGDSEHGWLLSNGLPGRIKPPRSMPCFLNVFVIVFVFVPVIVFVFVFVFVCVFVIVNLCQEAVNIINFTQKYNRLCF